MITKSLDGDGSEGLERSEEYYDDDEFEGDEEDGEVEVTEGAQGADNGGRYRGRYDNPTG